jgi:hypothetical protein
MIPGGRTVECSVRKALIKSNLNQNKSDGTVGALETIASTLHKKSYTVSVSTCRWVSLPENVQITTAICHV